MAKRHILPNVVALGAASYVLLCLTNVSQFGPNLFVLGRLVTAIGVGLAAVPLFTSGGGHPLRYFPPGLLVAAAGSALSAFESFRFRLDTFTAAIIILTLSLYIVSAASRAYIRTGESQHLSRAAGAFLVMGGVQGLFVILNVIEGDRLDVGPHALAGIAFVLISHALGSEGGAAGATEPNVT